MASTFGTQVRNDGGDIWLPLPITPELEWEGLVDELYDRILEIRTVMKIRRIPPWLTPPWGSKSYAQASGALRDEGRA